MLCDLLFAPKSMNFRLRRHHQNNWNLSAHFHMDVFVCAGVFPEAAFLIDMDGPAVLGIRPQEDPFHPQAMECISSQGGNGFGSETGVLHARGDCDAEFTH